jgi:hypothetical protein
VKTLIPCLALLSCPVAFCGESETSDAIQAVMYEFTYNAQTLAITHAQVIGGYPSVDQCREAMPRVAANGSLQLGSGELMQLQCSGIRTPDGAGQPAGKSVVAATSL